MPSLTPRHADVAFVLEGVAGVNALYAITLGTRAAAHFDFAVELAHGGRVLAEAHYAPRVSRGSASCVA